MHKPRRAYETGHRPKFLAFVNDSPECDRALRFAARRARRVGAGIVLLAALETGEEAPPLLGVADLIREEAEARAQQLLADAAARVAAASGATAETVLREGERAATILATIDADEDIALLVLGAPQGAQGPGVLVDALLASDALPFPIPIAIVPAGLTDAQIDAVA